MTDFRKAAQTATELMREVFEPTPLQRNDHLSDRFGADIWLKREDLTPVRSYKIRGAFNAMRKALAAGAPSLFVCASAGNHAQGVAFACRHFGVRGVIFMPVTTPKQKINKTKIFGGDAIEIRLIGDYFDDTLANAQAFCRDQGGHFLAPFDDDDVIEGQASIGVELLEQLGKAPDTVICPVGGGGLAAGLTTFFAGKTSTAYPEFWYVEPAGGPSLAAAVEAGGPVTLNKVDSFVDGAAVARIGARNFNALANVPRDHVLAAPEDRICGTMIEMLNIEGIVLEPAGALAVDALAQLRDQIAGKTVVCITSGGNFDFERLPEVKERALRYAGLKKYLVLRMPQRPGALKDFLNLLGPEDDISRFEYLKKSARNFGSVLIGIENKQADALADLVQRISDAGFVFEDITDNPLLSEFLI
jgi:threonine dehydratase